jgi:hypothetical protein
MSQQNIMKLDPFTLKVLTNFSSLNNAISIKKGNSLRTMNDGRSVLAEAVVPDFFPVDFAITDLRQLLNLISSLCEKQADIEFTDTHLKIVNQNDTIRYYYGSDKLFITPPDKKITLPSEDIFFTLTQEILQKINKATSIFGSKDISVQADPDNSDSVQVTVHSDIENKTASTWTIRIPGEYKTSFNAIYKTSNLKVLMDDYDVVISKAGISSFENGPKTLKYFIPTESDSTF